MNRFKKLLHGLLACVIVLGLLTALEARRGRGGHHGRGRRHCRAGRGYRGYRYGGGGRGYIGPYYYEPWGYGWGYNRSSYPWGYGYGNSISISTGSSYDRETLHEFRDIYRAADFDDVLNRNVFVIAKFYDDNAASRSMAQIDSYIMRKFSDKVRFIQIDVQKNKDLFETILGKHGQLITPSYILFAHGKMVDLRKEAIEKRTFKLLVRKLLKSE